MANDLNRIHKHFGDAMEKKCQNTFSKILDIERLLPKVLEDHFDSNHHLLADVQEENVEKEFETFIFSCANLETKRILNEIVDDYFNTNGHLSSSKEENRVKQEIADYIFSHASLEDKKMFNKILGAYLDKCFNKNSRLFDDVIKNDIGNKFVEYILLSANISMHKSKTEKKPKKIVSELNAKDLFSEAGYILYPECKTVKDVMAFKRYYDQERDEVLCTYKDVAGRLSTCRIWFAIKKDVDQINRDNPEFHIPEREDRYGTSVLSIQVDKRSGILSIKNRYNDGVENPDNTFDSNLDYIIPGLSDAFQKQFRVHFPKMGELEEPFELPDYINVGGKFYHYNYLIQKQDKSGDVYYCDNNVIIDNFKVQQLKLHQMLIDYFVFDFNKKEIKLYDEGISDCFCDTIGKITGMHHDADNTTLTINVEEGEDVILKLDSRKRIVSYYNPNLIECGDGLFHFNVVLKDISLPKLQACGHDFITLAEELNEINLPSLKTCGEGCLDSIDYDLRDEVLKDVEEIEYYDPEFDILED